MALRRQISKHLRFLFPNLVVTILSTICLQQRIKLLLFMKVQDIFNKLFSSVMKLKFTLIHQTMNENVKQSNSEASKVIPNISFEFY